ncbi:VOC family protein [Nakamurella sp. YIM 132087]|uniref:VOC family protein n=2 Tax=Nakamurella alba TaxID=2665158 RepID=A0A7K1FQK6_9ACTN|nr:VOC family protein [Nakamurella alba]
MRMALTMDCTDVPVMAEFWKAALGYEEEPPPPPFATREEWVASFGIDPDEDDDDGAWLHDPDGIGPRLSLLQVPEPKTAKNRLHIDVRVSADLPAEQKWPAIVARSAELIGLGAGVLAEVDGHHIVMADPEGNEFCVC